LIEAQPWHLVVVDEAHHARRKDFLNRGQYQGQRTLWAILVRCNACAFGRSFG
jgi:hypothetical protein